MYTFDRRGFRKHRETAALGLDVAAGRTMHGHVGKGIDYRMHSIEAVRVATLGA